MSSCILRLLVSGHRYQANRQGLTSAEGVQGGIGSLLADVGHGHATVAVLPAARSLGADHRTVLLFAVVGLICSTDMGQT